MREKEKKIDKADLQHINNTEFEGSRKKVSKRYVFID